MMNWSVTGFVAMMVVTCAFLLFPNQEIVENGVEKPRILSKSEILARYKAKSNAQNFVHNLKQAQRFGVQDLKGVKCPETALRTLMAGVQGKGKLVFKTRQLTENEIHAAVRFLEFSGDSIRLSVAGEFDAMEKELRRREVLCVNGACGKCIEAPLSPNLATAQTAGFNGGRLASLMERNRN